MPRPAKRKSKPKLMASYEPHRCVILAVDTAEVSGWSIWVNGVPVSCGVVNMLSSGDAGKAPCDDAMEFADMGFTEAVLVFERPFRGTSQGQFIGLWKSRWLAAGGAKKRMLGVYPATHRSCVLGKGWGSAKRDKVRDKEQEFALALAQKHDLNPTIAVHGDVAPSLVIGKWASHAGEVAKMLPKGRRV